MDTISSYVRAITNYGTFIIEDINNTSISYRVFKEDEPFEVKFHSIFFYDCLNYINDFTGKIIRLERVTFRDGGQEISDYEPSEHHI